MNNGYYITSDGEKVEFEAKNIVCLDNRKITDLILPEGIKIVWCSHNHLTNLILPQVVEKVWCHNNQLTKLNLPQGVEWIRCDLMDGIEEQNREGVSIIICQKN